MKNQHAGRNPFVNQVFVVGFCRAKAKPEHGKNGRNPFVNQVFVVKIGERFGFMAAYE